MRPPITPTYCIDRLTVPPVLPDPEVSLSLAEIVDLALENSPETRISWQQAKQAAAALGTARGQYLPPLTFIGNLTRLREVETDLGIDFVTLEDTENFTFSTTYLIADWGGRQNEVQAAKAALLAADWLYNWEIQTVMIGVIQNAYNYLNAEGILQADLANVEDQRTTLSAARGRVGAGVEGLSDQLQAETALIQAQLTLEYDRSTLEVARATLSRSCGLPADLLLKVEPLPERLAVERVGADVETLLTYAKCHRSDLMAARESVLQHRAKIKVAWSNFLPNFDTQVSGGKGWVNRSGKPEWIFNYSLNFNVPFFNSFADINAIRDAQSSWLESQAQLDDEELQALLTVMTDYYEVQAYARILQLSVTYVEVAQKNRDVAFANYKVGITDIIDLMTANNALNVARKQLVEAKTSWLASLANLAYDTGGLRCAVIGPNQTVVPYFMEKKGACLSTAASDDASCGLPIQEKACRTSCLPD